VSLFPTDDKLRKGMPVLKMITGYFPKAMREITKVCVANNARYNPGRDPFDINWARGKSKDQFGSMFRHVMENIVDGKVYEEVPPEVTEATGIERVYVLAEAAWRINAALELEIEKQEAALKATSQYTCDAAPGYPAPRFGCSCETCATIRGQAATGV
jgi:hypothetical protein